MKAVTAGRRRWSGDVGSLQLTPCCLFLNGTLGRSEKFTVTKQRAEWETERVMSGGWVAAVRSLRVPFTPPAPPSSLGIHFHRNMLCNLIWQKRKCLANYLIIDILPHDTEQRSPKKLHVSSSRHAHNPQPTHSTAQHSAALYSSTLPGPCTVAQNNLIKCKLKCFYEY